MSSRVREWAAAAAGCPVGCGSAGDATSRGDKAERCDRGGGRPQKPSSNKPGCHQARPPRWSLRAVQLAHPDMMLHLRPACAACKHQRVLACRAPSGCRRGGRELACKTKGQGVENEWAADGRRQQLSQHAPAATVLRACAVHSTG